MRPIATDVAHSAVCVCLYVGHTGELCKTGWTDRDAVWVTDSCRPKEVFVTWDPDHPTGRGTFEGHVAHCKYPDMSAFRTFRLPPPANVPAQRMRRTNAFSAARGD